MKFSESLKEFSPAFVKAQSAVKVAKKNRTNPHLRNTYADISSIWDACREALSSNGIAVTQQATSTENQRVSVVTLLLHSSGEWIEYAPLEIPVQKFDAQGTGSAITYAKRFALSAAVGVVSGDEDDDGEGAGKKDDGPPSSPEEQKILEFLRAESFKGSAALTAAHGAVPKSAAKSKVWTDHAVSLKDAAKKADEA